MRRIRRFGVIRTSNVFAVLYFVLSLIVLIPLALFAAAGPNVFVDPQTGIEYRFDFGSPVFIILLAFIYALAGWVFTAIFCLLYNLVARFTGGIEVQVESEAPRPDPAWQPQPTGWPQPPPQAPPPAGPPPAGPPPSVPPPAAPPPGSQPG
jgi:hypothetical protein